MTPEERLRKTESTLTEMFAYHKGWKAGFAACQKIWHDAMKKVKKKK